MESCVTRISQKFSSKILRAKALNTKTDNPPICKIVALQSYVVNQRIPKITLGLRPQHTTSQSPIKKWSNLIEKEKRKMKKKKGHGSSQNSTRVQI